MVAGAEILRGALGQAGIRLVVFGARLAADAVEHTCLRHEVTLVGTIDEDGAGETRLGTRLVVARHEAANQARDGVDRLQLLLGPHGDARFGEHFAENLESDLRLEIVTAARLRVLRVVEGFDLW